MHPETELRFVLPDGEQIPSHFHLTEVGYVTKRFVDCGGAFHESEACVLQIFVADDFEHRLSPRRFADILELGRSVLPGDDLEVEVEWDCGVISQYPIASASAVEDRLEFRLSTRPTDCLAKQKCGCEMKTPAVARTCCQ
ncbi:MAG: DUF6428 family protein [Chthoniobacterales bacterium]